MFFGGNIPGSRRNSLSSGTPGPKGTLIFTSPAKTCTAIKEDDEEGETTSLLEKMKEFVEDMQRRRSMQPEAIANVAISNTPEEGDEDEQDEILEVPATPQMSDLKHVFSEKRAANIPVSYAGVRDLFKVEPPMDSETPRLDGMREMFFRAQNREPRTPNFEGVGEMLATPAGSFVRDAARSNDAEMASPSPVPPVARRVVKKGSKIRAASAGAMPLPSSRTAISTPASSCARPIETLPAPAWRALSSKVRSTAWSLMPRRRSVS